jgi:hypothetical protein
VQLSWNDGGLSVSPHSYILSFNLRRYHLSNCMFPFNADPQLGDLVQIIWTCHSKDDILYFGNLKYRQCAAVMKWLWFISEPSQLYAEFQFKKISSVKLHVSLQCWSTIRGFSSNYMDLSFKRRHYIVW